MMPLSQVCRAWAYSWGEMSEGGQGAFLTLSLLLIKGRAWAMKVTLGILIDCFIAGKMGFHNGPPW